MSDNRHRRPRRYQNEYVRRMAEAAHRLDPLTHTGPPTSAVLEAAVLAAWRGYITAEAPPPDAAEAYIAGWCLAFGFVAAHGLPAIEQVQELLIRHPAAPRGDDGAD